MNNAECNLSDSTFEGKGDNTTIYAATNSIIGFQAIIAPQTIATNTTFATLTIGGEVYTWTTLEELSFSTGRQYIYNWDVTTNDVTLIGLINDWGETDDEETGSDVAYTRLSDYSSTSYPTDTDEWYIYYIYPNSDDFAGLRDALNTVSSESDREISIGFTNLQSVPEYAFYTSSSYTKKCLTRVSLPCATRIGSNAFRYCTGLKTLSTPKVTYIETYAFESCSSLISLDFSEVLTIESYAFQSCSSLGSLDSIELPKVLSIGSSAFNSCTSIGSITAESIITVGGMAFYNIPNLKTLSLPNATTISDGSGSYARQGCIEGCSSLQDVYIPEVTYVGSYAFEGCGALQTLSIPKLTYIGNFAFEDCDDLMSL